MASQPGQGPTPPGSAH